MVWYYKVDDQENGPVSKAELGALIKSKQLSAHSLVRSVEMDEWFQLIDVVRGKTAPVQTPPPPPPDDAFLQDMEMMDDTPDEGDEILTMEEEAETSPAKAQNKEMVVAEPADTEPTTVCSQCGRSFPEDQVIAFDDRLVCAACKPMFVQKLKEGAALPTTQKYGGFWIRFLAKFIDGIILGIGQWAIMIPMSMLMIPSMMQSGDQVPGPGFFIYIGFQVLLGIAVPLFYTTFFLGRWGATLGKMACGLKVVTPEGEKITYMRAFGRFFAEWVSMIILYIGYIMAGFDEEKRSLHDRICSTRVVKKS